MMSMLSVKSGTFYVYIYKMKVLGNGLLFFIEGCFIIKSSWRQCRFLLEENKNILMIINSYECMILKYLQ